MQPSFQTVAVLDLLLNRENPRHVSKGSQRDVIEYLLADEEVYSLARHMSQHGVNPLEVVAVFPDEDGTLVVAEGNRRVCAAQLLTDPEKAPESARARFRSLAAKSRDVSQINVALFEDYSTSQPWLQVLHDGEQDGVGRKRWKPEQKARATTNKSGDALAVALMDYAERQKIISGELRRMLQVSTATRYLANPKVRQAMGLVSTASSERILINTKVEIFNRILEYFFDGLKNRKLHSRSKGTEWKEYALELEELFSAVENSTPVTGVDDLNLTADNALAAPTMEMGEKGPTPINKIETPTLNLPSSKPSNGAALPESPAKSGKLSKAQLVTPETKYIGQSDDLVEGLNLLQSFKLSSLYKSLISLPLEGHPALLTTGAWVFIETLTALHGRNSAADFVAYLNPLLPRWGFGKEQAKEIRLSLEYLSRQGNAQKHSGIFTIIDARNLCNHFVILNGLFSSLVNECVAAKGKP